MDRFTSGRFKRARGSERGPTRCKSHYSMPTHLRDKAIDYSKLSPFQLKDELIQLAQQLRPEISKATQHSMLNAGRGNPNWIATTPREAFFLLGQFAIEESKRVWDEPDLGGMPKQEGIAARFSKFLDRVNSNGLSNGASLLRRTLDLGADEFGFDLDEFVFELTDGIAGDNYPVPDRILPHVEIITQKFLAKEMCDGRPPAGKFDIFATEGGTAAMYYVFTSLVENKILKAGDTIALGTPIFTPYLEIPTLNDFRFKSVRIDQSEVVNGRHTWQYPDSELRKLEDPSIKAFFVVNPGNPGSFAMRESSIQQIAEIVRSKRPDLIILTDDVYGTFVPGFRSLAAELPQNTILVYSYSKHFGVTGWRLGTIAIHEKNIFDAMIARLPQSEKEELRERYASLTLRPERIKFIDRIVADSRAVALNHTAGLSLPQQVQMLLLSTFTLTDRDDEYKKRCQAIVKRRMQKLYAGLGIPLNEDPLRTYYYADLDIGLWAAEKVSPEFAAYLIDKKNPLDIVFALAKKHGTVLLNGSGFDAPPWSVRVSLANLDDDAYELIGKDLMEVVQGVVREWEQSKAKKSA